MTPDEQQVAINESLANDDKRQEIALQLATEMYGSDDVEMGHGDTEPLIESVDGGYWIRARVWVYAEDVESRFSA